METIMQVKNIVRRFGSGETEVIAVRDISLDVIVGEVILIMGPSGSGKTTLLSMLGGLLKPSGGNIQIGEDDLTNLDERRLPDVDSRKFHPARGQARGRLFARIGRGHPCRR